jgi:hypothetical protein
MSSKDRFLDSCRDYIKFPLNLVYPHTYDHALNGYLERLNAQEKRLFYNESFAYLVIRDYLDTTNGRFTILLIYFQSPFHSTPSLFNNILQNRNLMTF